MLKKHISDWNWTRIGLHTLFWAVYLPLNAVLTCIMYHQPLEKKFGEAFIGETFSLPVKMALTYFVFYYIIPLYLDRNKVTKLVISLLGAFGVTILAYRIVLGGYFAIFRPNAEYFLFDMSGLLLTAFDCFITVAAASTIKFIRLHYKSLEFEQELLREKLESELSFLRAQTNPHFLFNTLNNLYVLARKKSDKTPDAIMMLSKIMRFVLYECRAAQIPLINEAKVIQDYVELEKLRYNERLTVIYEENIDDPAAPIAPLLLLPFVENSFKHGASSTTGDAEILIRLELSRGHMHFVVSNTFDPEASDQNSGGIGLKNVQRQLDLLYSGIYKLVTTANGNRYEVTLDIQLHEE